MAIITRTQYKTWRNISVTTYDALIDLLIAAAQAQVELWCGRLFDSANDDEFLSGNGGRSLSLRRYPVTQVTQVDIYATPGGSYTTLTSDDDYHTEAATGLLYRSNAIHGRIGAARGFDGWPPDITNTDWGVTPNWPEGRLNVRVQYSGGYTTTPTNTWPPDLQLAFYQYLDLLWQDTWGSTGSTMPATGIKRERIDKYEYELGETSETNTAVATARGLFVTQARMTELFGAYKRGDLL